MSKTLLVNFTDLEIQLLYIQLYYLIPDCLQDYLIFFIIARSSSLR